MAHYDPGLLSLSFLSTHDGLQLHNPTTNTWHAGISSFLLFCHLYPFFELKMTNE